MKNPEDMSPAEVKTELYGEASVDPADGWQQVVLEVDPPGRRGVWFRHRDGTLEIRAGREGYDVEVAFTNCTNEQVEALKHVVHWAFWLDHGAPSKKGPR